MENAQPQGPQSETLRLSEDEKKILDLYDRLQKLQLEIALITAQKSYLPGETQTHVYDKAQTELLESRAKYALRHDVAESVIMASPVLQAVHGGPNASPIERDILPVLHERDSTSTTLARQSILLKQVTEETIDLESQNLQMRRKNVDLATQVLSLAAEVNQRNNQTVNNPKQAEDLANLQKDVNISRQRWRTMKATSSAIVAGSGVNWSEDDQLRSIVLDNNDDGV